MALCCSFACAPARAPTRPPSPLVMEDAFADGQPPALPGRLVPRKPLEWQKRAPCGPKEKELFDACYRRAHPDDYSPPCEKPTVEYEGTCYYAMQKAERPDTSKHP